MLKVLIINYEYPPFGGGAGRATREIAVRLKHFGVEPTLLVGTGKGSEQPADDGVRIIPVPIPRKGLHNTGGWGMLCFWFSAAARLRNLLAESPPCLIHYFFSVPTGLLSLFPGHAQPYLLSLRGGDIPGYNPGQMQMLHLLLKPLNRRIIRRSGKVVALSRHLAGHAGQVFPGRDISVIPNGVNTDRFFPMTETAEPAPEKRLRLITVCRLVEWKGIQYLLTALNSLRHCVAGLKIIGTGPFADRLKQMTQERGLTDLVRFVGYVPYEELVEHYNAAEVFVMPSFGDSFGQTFTEAMACGLPIVAARHGGVSDFVENGRNGLLVEPHSPNAIAAAITRLASDFSLRARMRTANIAKCRHDLGWNRIAEAYARLYRQIVAGRES